MTFEAEDWRIRGVNPFWTLPKGPDFSTVRNLVKIILETSTGLSYVCRLLAAQSVSLASPSSTYGIGAVTSFE